MKIDSKIKPVVTKKGSTLCIFLLIGLIGWGIFKQYSEKNAIKENPAWVWGEVFDTHLEGNGYHGLAYKYVVNGEIYHASERYNHNLDISIDACVGYQFRVLYSKEKPEISRMLLVEQDYKEFDIMVPQVIKKRIEIN